MSGLGARLKRARERKDLKQTQVKVKTGINNKTLSGYENEVSEPDIETLKTLAELYDVSLDWLSGKEAKNTNNSINNDQAKNDELYDIISRLPQDKKESLLKLLQDT